MSTLTAEQLEEWSRRVVVTGESEAGAGSVASPATALHNRCALASAHFMYCSGPPASSAK